MHGKISCRCVVIYSTVFSSRVLQSPPSIYKMFSNRISLHKESTSTQNHRHAVAYDARPNTALSRLHSILDEPKAIRCMFLSNLTCIANIAGVVAEVFTLPERKE